MNIKIARYITYLLRHNPENLEMDRNGWVSVVDLLKKTKITSTELEEIVKLDNKQRFNFNDNKSKIRANQGHSLDVSIEMDELEPPDILFHGTSAKSIEPIMSEGLLSMSRQHVHLSDETTTACDVGKRHCKGNNVVIFKVDCKSMYEDGIIFYLSSNGIWLVDYVDPKYLSILIFGQ